jgi:hypothetical protein
MSPRQETESCGRLPRATSASAIRVTLVARNGAIIGHHDLKPRDVFLWVLILRSARQGASRRTHNVVDIAR